MKTMKTMPEAEIHAILDTARQNARRRAHVRLGRRHRAELETLIRRTA